MTTSRYFKMLLEHFETLDISRRIGENLDNVLEGFKRETREK